MSELTTFLVQASLVILIVLLIPCVYRVLKGESFADRLQAIEATMILLIGIIVLLMLVQQSPFILDVGIALAAFSFIATLGISRYLSEGQIF